MGIQKPGLLEQLIINGGLPFVPIQVHADRGFDITHSRQVGRTYHAKCTDGKVLSGRLKTTGGKDGDRKRICGGQREHGSVLHNKE